MSNSPQGFAIMPLPLLLDPKITPTTKSVYAVLTAYLSFTGGAVTHHELAEHLNVSTKTVQRALAVLRDQGYVAWQTEIHDGMIAKNTYSVITGEIAMPSISGRDMGVPTDIPVGTNDLPETAEPSNLSRDMGVPTGNSVGTNDLSEAEFELDLGIDTRSLRALKTHTDKPSPVTSSNDPRFVAFWTAYPRKIAKAEAMKCYAKVIKNGVDPEVILDAVRRYDSATADKDLRYVAFPATWLNQGRWEDELEVPAVTKSASTRVDGWEPEPGGPQPWLKAAQ